ncbi:hypothetical protein [Burkholderia phage BCSR5]|nr:hypothetical protein [Burkholderia phage BCSR5]
MGEPIGSIRADALVNRLNLYLRATIGDQARQRIAQDAVGEYAYDGPHVTRTVVVKAGTTLSIGDTQVIIFETNAPIVVAFTTPDLDSCTLPVQKVAVLDTSVTGLSIQNKGLKDATVSMVYVIQPTE